LQYSFIWRRKKSPFENLVVNHSCSKYELASEKLNFHSKIVWFRILEMGRMSACIIEWLKNLA
jgi:hypothetical protein